MTKLSVQRVSEVIQAWNGIAGGPHESQGPVHAVEVERGFRYATVETGKVAMYDTVDWPP